VARAGAQVDAARLVIRADCHAAERIAHENRAPTIEEKLCFKRNAAWAMEQCTEAVDALHALAGANGIYDRYPIQRIFRDQHALSAHIGFSWDAQGGPWALVAMGGEFVSPTM
jgi:3-hydroxy-9,10-secoandrosta-1,3,5(10)-triene-9,17-dione monooxygenase